MESGRGDRVDPIRSVEAGVAGRVVVEARRRAGLTQQQLADRASVPQSTVSVYERGGREPTLPTLARLVGAAGFRVVVDLVPIGLDLDRNGRVLRDLLALVDIVPITRRRAELSYPRVPERSRR